MPALADPYPYQSLCTPYDEPLIKPFAELSNPLPRFLSILKTYVRDQAQREGHGYTNAWRTEHLSLTQGVAAALNSSDLIRDGVNMGASYEKCWSPGSRGRRWSEQRACTQRARKGNYYKQMQARSVRSLQPLYAMLWARHFRAHPGKSCMPQASFAAAKGVKALPSRQRISAEPFMLYGLIVFKAMQSTGCLELAVREEDK